MKQLEEIRKELVNLRMRIKMEATNQRWQDEYANLKKQYSQLQLETLTKERNEKNDKHKGK